MKREEMKRHLVWVGIDPDRVNMMMIMSAYKSSSRPIVDTGSVEFDKNTGEIISYEEFLDRFMKSLDPPVKEWPRIKHNVRVMIVSRKQDDPEWETLFDEFTHNIND
jgi:hypothetical protein